MRECLLGDTLFLRGEGVGNCGMDAGIGVGGSTFSWLIGPKYGFCGFGSILLLGMVPTTSFCEFGPILFPESRTQSLVSGT